MDEYSLPSHSFCCRRGDVYVFLDLKQDDYVLVDGHAATALHKLAARTELSSADVQALGELLASGLLTKQPNAGRRFTATRSALAIEPLLETEPATEDTDQTNITLSHWRVFFTACLSATIKLRFQRIERTVTAVAERKARHGATADLRRARELTAIFQKLRGLFPANYLCLFDSLALIEFLAHYNVYPTWMFGVKLEPWQAHCWVQQGHVAFNEEVEEAARFTPIMAV